MNRSAAAFAASSLPALTLVFGGSTTIDGDTSTTSITSSGVVRPVHCVPTACAHCTGIGSSVIRVVVMVAETTTVSSPIVVPAYENVALPSAPVVTSAVRGLTPVTAKWTTTPGAGAPWGSSAVTTIGFEKPITSGMPV